MNQLKRVTASLSLLRSKNNDNNKFAPARMNYWFVQSHSEATRSSKISELFQIAYHPSYTLYMGRDGLLIVACNVSKPTPNIYILEPAVWHKEIGCSKAWLEYVPKSTVTIHSGRLNYCHEVTRCEH